MRTVAKNALAFLLVAGLGGCARYDVKEDKQGRTVRVDRWTGEVTVLAGDKMLKVKTPEEQEAEKKEDADLAKPKYMANIELAALGGGTATLVTSWRESKLSYRFSIRPIPKKLADIRRNGSSASLVLIFYDQHGFKIKDITVPVSSTTGNVDDVGAAQALSMDDSDFCTREDYRRVAAWNLSWQGFGPN